VTGHDKGDLSIQVTA